MGWAAEPTEEFTSWYESLNERDADAVDRAIGILQQVGPALGRPQADTVRKSRYRNMKELRVQSSGRPLRLFFIFDPRRVAVLLLGDDKKGDDRFYDRMVAKADALYEVHLSDIN